MESAEIASSAHEIEGKEDLLTEILLRTPPKSLLRFKCVSKRWRSLISTPFFSRLHSRRRPSAVSGVFLSTPSDLVDSHWEFVSLDRTPSAASFRSLNFAHDPQGIKILQSCNGLLLCCSIQRAGRSYYIYNPTTKHFSALTLSDAEVCTSVYGIALAFDPSRSPHYKVVCVRNSVLSVYQYEIEVYSSETGSWRYSGDPLIPPFDMGFYKGVFWNGAIHWLSPTGASLYYNVDGESTGAMPALPVLGDWTKRRIRYFGESRGHLHLIEIYGPRTTQFKVFEMERDYSRWSVRYEADLDAVIDEFPEMVCNYLDACDLNYYAFFVLCVVREENEEESSLLLHIPGKVLSYNFKDKTAKKLCDLAPNRVGIKGLLQFGWLDAYQYIETLSCV